ncbi:DNA-3-methyladenine glycosylase family protein [Actinomycetospora termitidis]|uniref:DNA-3-methyladenine glycosylase 2 family protein n=1 Tax=Actinomycetospora termitidis TaxID=3053470 RepID=A0ABT7MK21_9PSEU|nr:DNA-3-methyladenine glycosylase 2 family protein [Actinomycetospora sp. Odt1-22]MDL5160332.1 DNA-3-methyladenine glycosylase 2 family protein [Actinomycetospora sp. Odt1-22]
MTSTHPDVSSAAMLTPDVTISTSSIRPDGPFSLTAARSSVMRWAPVARHAGPDDGGPLVLGAIADDDLAPLAVTVDQDRPDGPVTIGTVGTGSPDRALAQAARILSLDRSGAGLDDVARRDPAVGTVLAAHPGRRPVLFPSVYEAAAWAVISPRVGKAQAATLTRGIAADHGTRLAGVDCFPSPATLLRVEEIPGLPAEKVRRLHGVARAALDGDLDVERLRALGPVGARAALRRVRGIGEFWSSGIWLRACGVVDEWPDEPRATAALARLHGRDPADYADPAVLAAALAPLAPYRTWIAFLLRITNS